MHPAKSVIYFTVATGAGYGLFIWLAVLSYHGMLPADNRLFTFVVLAISLGLIITGLLSSTLHLGHPERAWRALSQWRSSWLSREGVMAILTFIPVSIFACLWFFQGQNTGIAAIIGLIGGVMALLTVFTTSMIYASIKAIPAWYNSWTKLGYLVMSLMSGAVLIMAITSITGLKEASEHMFVPVSILLILGFFVKTLYWQFILRKKAVSTAESATGLGGFGKVSLAGSPHSSDNYLLKEMGFRIARKHASKIRFLAVVLGFILPFILVGTAIYYAAGYTQSALVTAAALSTMLGLVFERWLFFAEAKHAVTLYYGESKV